MKNEKRLVSAEAISRKLKNAHCAECNVVRQIQCSACWVNDVLELLAGDNVDAVEVVHGKWVHKGAWHIECSECQYILAHIGEAKNYCPQCGAKMDGGNEDA